VQVPKLVVFDVDGTLVNWDGEMTAVTANTLQQLRSMGIPIALATGRPLALASKTVAIAGGADWIVCGNGAALRAVSTGKMLRDRALPDEIVEPLIEGMRDAVPGVGFAVELADTIIEEAGFARRVPEESLAPPVADVLPVFRAAPESVRRVLPFHDDYDEQLPELGKVAAQFVDDRCQVLSSGLPFVEVSPAGDHKAIALQVLVDHMGIAAADVIAFGDGGNDLEMLRWAGTGVAMGNARPEVQAAADAVTAPIDGAGISEFLQPLVS